MAEALHERVVPNLLTQAFLQPDRAVRVGAISSITYTTATVLTHDSDLLACGGIPQFGFLLAARRSVGDHPELSTEILLLRVDATVPLALDTDVRGVHEELISKALATYSDTSPGAEFAINADPVTRSRIGYTGRSCSIVGTFYEEQHEGQSRTVFGHDVENIFSSAMYLVYKPYGLGLSTIASYTKPRSTPAEKVRLGVLRPSSTRLLQQQQLRHLEAVARVDINDFIGHKTGMFGMTRMGKSNTMKTIVSRIFIASERRRQAQCPTIGQLIFDPQGEYANDNTQDGTSLAAIGPQHSVLYRFGVAPNANVRPLAINFFDPEQIDAVQRIVASLLAGSDSDYVKAFLSVDLAVAPAGGNDDTYRQASHASRARLLVYGALVKAGLVLPAAHPNASRAWSTSVSMNQELFAQVSTQLPQLALVHRKGFVEVSAAALLPLLDWLTASSARGATVTASAALQSFTDNDAWRNVAPLYTRMYNGGSISGYTKLAGAKVYHSPYVRKDYRHEIYEELTAGHIVVVDVHLGPEVVTRKLAEQLVDYIVTEQTEHFTENRTPPLIQVVLEEAHVLFAKDQYERDQDVWVRLAKEGSKLNIGMLYATQEVTGVAHQVLANTKNWVVAHLNNTREVQELAKFYEFAVFKDAIIKHEDQGYVRLKTMSSPYILPVQIDQYGLPLVNEARVAAGLPPLAPAPEER